MPTGKDPTRILKTPATPRTAVKLGVTAAWSKLKYQTSQTFNNSKNDANGTPITGAVNGHQNPRLKQTIKIGPNGEILVSYGNCIEVWDWIPSSLQLKEMETQGALKDIDGYSGLYLVASLYDLKQTDEILDLDLLQVNQDRNTYKVLLTIRRSNETLFVIKNFGQLYEEDMIEKQLILPPSVYGFQPFTLRSSERFIGISTGEGSLTVFDERFGHPLPLTIDVATSNGTCLFDIQGRYLAYVSSSPEDALNNGQLTELNVPSHSHTVYSKILQNLSITAIDGLSKLSDINSLKKALGDKNLKSNVRSYISSLMNGLPQDKKVIVMDLETQERLAEFKPPNGVSNISLSPFNTNLITISQRGDQLYKWELTRLPEEITLVDIQLRGKTGSIVDQIHWYSNNVFQILTRSSGSIHCFHSESISKNWVLPNLSAAYLGKASDSLLALSRNSNKILVINMDGSSDLYYQMPSTAIAKSLLPNFIPLDPVSEITIRNKKVVKHSPLSQVEIDTCLLGPPVICNSKIEFGTYDFQPGETFWNIYRIFGNDISYRRTDFGNGDGRAVFHSSEDDLTSAMKDCMIFNQQ